MPNTADSVRAKVDAFVADIARLVRSEALRTIAEALGARLSTGPSGTNRKRIEPKPNDQAVRAVSIPNRKAGERRSTDGMANVISVVSSFIKANPGARAEHIAKGVGTTSKELALPIKKLLAEGIIRSKGQKRGTKYWAA